MSSSPRSLAAAPHRPRHALRPAASYSVVTGGSPSSSDGSGGGSGQLKLIVYSKEGCHLCEGLKEKLEALLDRAAFLPSALRCGGPPLHPAICFVTGVQPNIPCWATSCSRVWFCACTYF